MEVSRPVLDVKGQSHTFQIRCTDIKACGLRLTGQPRVSLNDISGVLQLFIQNAPDQVEIELDDLRHIWNTQYEGELYNIADDTEIQWIPKIVRITPLYVSIEWIIFALGPGSPALSLPGKAALHRRRIREARLRVAAARLRAEQLVEAYYTKYGPALLGDDDSSLSDG
jgi:hypothetical protein